jgi:signal transduction histidine kinase
MELTGLRRDGSEFPLELSLGYWLRHQDIFFTGIVRDITARKQDEDALHRREWELQQSQEELQALGARLISAQEDERRRLARDLHDDMSQRLTVVFFEVQSLRKHLAESDPMQETLTCLKDQVSVLSDNVRQLAHQLHPSILDELGLEAALHSVVQEFSKWSHVTFTFRPQNGPSYLSPDTALCLYRVTQECLRNVARHAQASHVSVEVTGRETGLQLVISDNGRGFIPEAVRRGTHGLGLIGIKERIRAVKGTIEVHSSIGQGTTITVWIPLLFAAT